MKGTVSTFRENWSGDTEVVRREYEWDVWQKKKKKKNPPPQMGWY